MTRYLLVETRPPAAVADAEAFLGLARDLAGRGHPVAVFLLQDAVLAARAGRRGAGDDAVARLVADPGTTVWSEELAMAERGVAPGDLDPGVRAGSMADLVALLMTPGCVPVWH